ncbi:MAG: hypothetical protein GXO07_02995 [Crenarchaeota archaeon]|nr:hypothetical protein [Thermoproteota archaeon]
MIVMVCSNLSECKEKVERTLNELEREAEFVAGVLENVDEKVANFEELKKVFGGEVGDAFYKAKVDSVEIFIQPNPALLREELSERAKEVSKLIEMYRQLNEILEKIIEIMGDAQAEVVLTVDTNKARAYISI